MPPTKPTSSTRGAWPAGLSLVRGRLDDQTCPQPHIGASSPALPVAIISRVRYPIGGVHSQSTLALVVELTALYATLRCRTERVSSTEHNYLIDRNLHAA